MAAIPGETKQYVGEKLSHIRQVRSKTQSDVADFLGVRKTSVSAWARGTNAIDNDSLYRLANYFHVDMNYFFGMDGDKYTSSVSEVLDELFAGKEYENVEFFDALRKFVSLYDTSQGFKWFSLCSYLDYLTKMEQDALTIYKSRDEAVSSDGVSFDDFSDAKTGELIVSVPVQPK